MAAARGGVGGGGSGGGRDSDAGRGERFAGRTVAGGAGGCEVTPSGVSEWAEFAFFLDMILH